MSYVSSNLVPGETVKYLARISKWSLLPDILFGIILLPLFGVGLLFFASAALKFYTTELAITNKRVIAKFGFIQRKTVELNLPKVEAIQVDQSIIGRMFNYGSVIVSGGGNPQAPIKGISQPLSFRNNFFQIAEAA